MLQLIYFYIISRDIIFVLNLMSDLDVQKFCVTSFFLGG